MLVVRFASLFDVKDRTVTFLGGKKYSMDTLRAMGAGDLLNSMFDFSEKLMNLGLSEEEMNLFTAVVLVSAGGLLDATINQHHPSVALLEIPVAQLKQNCIHHRKLSLALAYELS